MASPRRIFQIYHALGAEAELVRDFQQAKGEKVPGTVNLLCVRDAGALLAKWGEEMEELAGVIDGSHDDPYILESSQTFYWASLYAIVQGKSWEDLGFELLRHELPGSGIDGLIELRASVKRLIELGPETAKPAKLFLLWLAADAIYRRTVPAAKQWTIEQIMESDLQEMRKREYLKPLLANSRD